MTDFKDYIVVEFDWNARFLVKTRLFDFNNRKKKEFQSGHVNPNMHVVAVYELESEANDYIASHRDYVELFIDAINKGNEQPF